MADEMTMAPQGNGSSPIALVEISATDLATAGDFYATVFGWTLQHVPPDQTEATAAAGPAIRLRARSATTGDAAQGTVLFLATNDMEGTLTRVVEGGGTAEGEAWTDSESRTLARFRDPWGSIHGLATRTSSAATPRIPVPFGDNPKPADGSVCSLELHAGDLAVAARFFGELFGWGTQETMPQYMGFDPGAGVGGVFQSHTPTMSVVAYLYASDVAATLTAIDAAGGKRMGEPMAMAGMATMDWRGHISIDPERMHGAPCMRGTRVPVYVILDNLAAGESPEAILAEYPSLNPEHMPAALAYAAALAHERVVQIPA